MCGRYALVANSSSIAEYFQAISFAGSGPRYNIAPGQPAPVIRKARNGGYYEVVMMRWGLIPYWALEEKIGFKMINARAETLRQKPGFKDALRTRRCLVPATGFYEWEKRAGQKFPHLVEIQEQAMFALAGLWERWKSPETGEVIESYTIITCEANAVVAQLHERMPAILERDQYAQWFGGSVEEALELLKPYPGERMRLKPMSQRLNSAALDDVSLHDPDEQEPG